MSNNRRRRKVSKSDSVAAVREEDDAVLGKAEATPFFHGLPDELVLKVFSQLATFQSALREDDLAMAAANRLNCFGTVASAPHAGLRQFPFLGQVCKRWRDLLDHPASQAQLWQEVVVDFGQELVTSVHRPIKWSDARPNDAEFKLAFAQTRISAQRIFDFVKKRHCAVRRLVLLNSEGYWSDEHDFVSLRHKHNFGASSFGVLLCLLRENLKELWVQQCNGLFPAGSDSLDAISCCAGSLRALHLMDLHSHVSGLALAGLSSLTRLEELTVGTGTSTSDWALIGPVGITALPDSWKNLRCLRRLALRGHHLLRSLPDWLMKLPLQSLELALCRNVVDLGIVSQLTSLSALVLQGMALTSTRATNSQLYSGWLPQLSQLTALTSLCLADNCLTELPPLAALKQLVCLDLSGNAPLQIAAPLTPMLTTLPRLRLVDMRAIHEERDNCWSDAKCKTMSHVAALAKAMKRRRPPGYVKFCPQ